MTTVQLSSTFNTVHKNTSHINEQSVYTQGRPRTCDHMERFHGKLPHGASISLSLSLSLSLAFSLSLFLSLPLKHGLYVQKRFSARVAGRAKKGRNVPRESTVFHQEPKLFTTMLLWNDFIKVFFGIVTTNRTMLYRYGSCGKNSSEME